MRSRASCRALLLLALAWPRPSAAQEPATAEPLRVSLRDALRRGAAEGPGVAPARAPLPATREAAGTAGRLLRAPQLTLTGGYRGGSGVGGPELGVGVAQDVPLANVGARRSEVARAWGEQTRQELREASLSAATRAGLAWSYCVEADGLYALRREALRQAESVLHVSRARVSAGTSLPSDEALARSDVAAAAAAALAAEGQVIEAYAELRHAIGQPPSARVVAVGSLEPQRRAQDLETSVPSRAVESNPSLASALARAKLAQSQTELVAAVQGPGLVLGGQYLREGTGTQVVTGFVGLPLPFTNPARFDRAREHGLAERARAEVTDVRRELQKALRLAAHDRVHWREAAAALDAGAAAAGEALRITLASFEAGTQDISPVLVARQRWLSAREQAVHAKAEVARADVRFDALTGHLREGSAP